MLVAHTLLLNKEKVINKFIKLFSNTENKEKIIKNLNKFFKDRAWKHINLFDNKNITTFIDFDGVDEDRGVAAIYNNEKYSIILAKWEDVLAFNVELKGDDLVTLLAYLVYDMTWVGFSSRLVNKERQRIEKIAEKYGRGLNHDKK